MPARTVWVPGHCYPEFYLEDAEGKGHWFPCQAAGVRSFGGIDEKRPILQKGDNFTVPKRREKQRYVSEFLKGDGWPAARAMGTRLERGVTRVSSIGCKKKTRPQILQIGADLKKPWQWLTHRIDLFICEICVICGRIPRVATTKKPRRPPRRKPARLIFFSRIGTGGQATSAGPSLRDPD